MTDAGATSGGGAALDLAELVSLLREAGFSPDTRRYLSANQLLLALAEHGIAFDPVHSAADRQRFVSHMAPVFCANAEEQARFSEIVDDWLHVPPPDIGKQAESGSDDKDTATNLSAWWGLAVALPLLGILAGLVWFRGVPCDSLPILCAAPTVSPTVQPPTPIPVKSVTAATFSVNPRSAVALLPIASSPLVVVALEKVFAVGLAAFATTLLGLWWRGRPRKPLGLLRLPSTAANEGRTFGLECTPPEPLTGPEVRRLVGSLRRPREQIDVALDPPATANASANAAGLFTPISRPRRRMPVYVALISRLSSGDHQTRQRELLLDQLVRAGVTITRYYFEQDPRVCRAGDLSSRALLLEELAVIEQDATLMLFADAAICIDPFSGDLASWVSKTGEWHRRVLFTADAPHCWGSAEQLVAASGFIVLPDGPQGLKAFADIGADWSIDQVPAPYARAYPSLLCGDTRRWLDRNAPPPETRDKMLRQLRGYLGPHGLAWLAACAVYPEIAWPLTLRLADLLPHLFPDDPPREPLKNVLPALVRVPWLRHAYLPDWLRIALLRQLGAEREQIARDFIGTLLHDLKIVPRDAFEIVPLQGAAAPDAKGQAVGDAVYLGFMSGASLNPLAVLAPNHLRTVFRSLRDLPSISTQPAQGWRQYLVSQWHHLVELAPSWPRALAFGLIALLTGGAAMVASRPLFSVRLNQATGGYDDVAFFGKIAVLVSHAGSRVEVSQIDRQGKLQPAASEPMNDQVRRVVFSRSGDAAVAFTDTGIESFRWSDGKAVKQSTRFEPFAGGELSAVSFGKGVIAGMSEQGAGAWTFADGTYTALSSPQPMAISVSAADDTIAVAYRSRAQYGSLGLYGPNGKSIGNQSLPARRDAAVSAVAAHSPDLAACGMTDGSVSILDASMKGASFVRLAPPGDDTPTAIGPLSFSVDGRWLVAGDVDGVQVWDLKARSSPGVRVPTDGVVQALAIESEGERIAVLTSDHVTIFDLNVSAASATATVRVSSPTPASVATSTQVGPTATATVSLPRVYLHVPTDRDAKSLYASGLFDVLKRAGFDVMPTDVKAGLKDGIEIRYFEAESTGAQRLQRVFKNDLGVDARLQTFEKIGAKQPTREYHYEIWFAPGTADLVVKAMQGRAPRSKK